MKKILPILMMGLLVFTISYQLSGIDCRDEIAIKTKKRKVDIKKIAPILSVTKKANRKIVEYRKKVKITIEIENNSNKTAYNISLNEEEPPTWAFNVSGTLNVNWTSLRPNQTVYHQYTLTPTLRQNKNVSLSKTKIIWGDNERNQYTGYSEELHIKIQYTKAEVEDWGKIWEHSIIGINILVALIILPLLLIEFKTYREYQKNA